MTWILAIDPGSEQSAVLRYDVVHHTVDCAGILKNPEALEWLDATEGDVLVVEDTKAYTLPLKAGKGAFFPEQVRVATFWAGRFVERWGGAYSLMDRRRVKQLLCGVTTVGDAQVRDAILDRFGGTRQRAIGTVKQPGPLHGIKRDLFAALAVAIAYCEEMDTPHSMGGGEG